MSLDALRCPWFLGARGEGQVTYFTAWLGHPYWGEDAEKFSIIRVTGNQRDRCDEIESPFFVFGIALQTRIFAFFLFFNLFYGLVKIAVLFIFPFYSFDVKFFVFAFGELFCHLVRNFSCTVKYIPVVKFQKAMELC